ncbi:type VI secretion system-associated protein TagF [Photobacterium sp. TY1-4]|uniref:type VI secretion system-associated protein TagF n=1 Tax=Photobacterium sp. TY1-4 TaxID=2899122 RepID=UPI0021C1C788|nr:type VI secretion system-associated protein TagF [Photobacterium sp. TY1-4]UXI02683.1 type VI secretion system-associated protein TagF [Photobacterium sp. TY1-4]
MSGTALISKFGYFGKVPERGDYIYHDVSVEFTEVWSEWLQSVLAVSKEQLAEQWLEAFLTSPVWHFSLSPGVCSDKTVIGTMMPSVDQVGRHYFFTTVREVNKNPYDYWMSRDWSLKIERHLLKLYDDENALEPWLATFSDNDWLIEDEPVPSSPRIMKGMIVVDESESDSDYFIHHLAESSFDNYCIWWTSGSQKIQKCKFITSGLPLVGQFSAMLDGEWQKWGW